LRVWLPHMVIAALVLVVAVLVLTSVDTEARRYILTDGFNGVDGSAPDMEGSVCSLLFFLAFMIILVVVSMAYVVHLRSG